MATTVKCPKCGKRAKLEPFGYGWVARCCGDIIYNSKDLPPKKTLKTEPDDKGEYWQNKMCRDGKIRLVKCHNFNQGVLC